MTAKQHMPTFPLPAQEAAAPPARLDGAIPDLVAQVYAAAPQDEQRKLLAMLLEPLGLLSLAAIGSGIFAHLRLRGGWPEFRPAIDDLNRVRTSDMVALVHHVQQVSIETVQSLAAHVKGSPVMAGSAAAAVLVAMLVQHSRRRRGEAGERIDDAPSSAPST
jgi:uncharacterized protein YoaH (UPF0181 family)